MANVLARRICVSQTRLQKVCDLSSATINSRCNRSFLVNFNNAKRRNFLTLGNLPLIYQAQYIYPQTAPLIRHFSKNDAENENKKLSIFQRFKRMYKEYWYVLVPVHMVTSAAWFGGFYYLAKSGVDVPSMLESLHISEKIVNPLRDSKMGYIAISYALYKITTPVRYMVTLGGTTLSINYLRNWGYIKPIPSKERLKEMYFEKKDDLLDTFKETQKELKQKKGIIEHKIKDKREDLIDDLGDSIKRIKGMQRKMERKSTVVEEVKKSDKKKKE